MLAIRTGMPMEMFLFRIALLTFQILFSLGRGDVFAQSPVPPAPASLILLVLDDPAGYGSIRLGGEEFGSFRDAGDGGFFLRALAGRNELRIQAEDCPDQPITLNLAAGVNYLLTLNRVINPEAKPASPNPKILRHQLVTLEGLPQARQKAEVAALYLQGSPPSLTGSVVHGMSAARTVNLPKGRVIPLGQGKTGMEIGGKHLIFCSPPDEPLVYLFVLFERDGILRSVKSVF